MANGSVAGSEPFSTIQRPKSRCPHRSVWFSRLKLVSVKITARAMTAYRPAELVLGKYGPVRLSRVIHSGSDSLCVAVRDGKEVVLIVFEKKRGGFASAASRHAFASAAPAFPPRAPCADRRQETG